HEFRLLEAIELALPAVIRLSFMPSGLSRGDSRWQLRLCDKTQNDATGSPRGFSRSLLGKSSDSCQRRSSPWHPRGGDTVCFSCHHDSPPGKPVVLIETDPLEKNLQIALNSTASGHFTQSKLCEARNPGLFSSVRSLL